MSAPLSVSAASSSSSGSSPSVTVDRVPLAAAPEDDLDLLADRGLGDDPRQAAHPVDLLAVELQDHVARLDLGQLGRPVRRDARDQRARRRRADPRLSAISSVTVWMRTPSQPRLTRPSSFSNSITGTREIGRDREADADVAAARREDRRVDADHLAVEIEARAAGIAAIDRRVDLQEIVVGSGPDVARAGRDDARGDRAAEPERIADGDDPVADPDRVAVGEGHRGKGLVDLDLEQRQIGLGVAPDQLGVVALVVVEHHLDLVGFGDHVVVGDHEAARDRPRSPSPGKPAAAASPGAAGPDRRTRGKSLRTASRAAARGTAGRASDPARSPWWSRC